MKNTKPTTIDQYIQNAPKEVQGILENIRQTIHHAAPELTESVSYGMPTFNLNKKHLIYFAAWKNHIGLYPIYADGGVLKDELAPYRKEKDSVHFPFTEPFPYHLVEKIVRMRLDEESHE